MNTFPVPPTKISTLGAAVALTWHWGAMQASHRRTEAVEIWAGEKDELYRKYFMRREGENDSIRKNILTVRCAKLGGGRYLLCGIIHWNIFITVLSKALYKFLDMIVYYTLARKRTDVFIKDNLIKEK